jgi:multidrug efflux pump subunit AcrB
MTDQNTNNEAEVAQTENLGIAGGMAKAFIHSPLSPLLLMVCIAVGIMGLLFTPRQEDPQISVPMADIFVQFPGGSSEEVANLVARPLERIMSEIVGVKHVYSASMREQAMVTVQFKVGEDMEESLVKLYDKLESNKDAIPPGTLGPLVKPKGVDDVPVVTLTLWSEEVDDATLKLIALETLQEINEVKNTSLGFVVSGRTEELSVEVLPEKLSGYGLSLGQIAQTIRSANGEMGAGNVEAWGNTFPVYTGSFLKTVEDVERLVIGTHNQNPIYVRDVANVTLGPSEASSIIRYYTGAASELEKPVDGAQAVTIAIAKKKGSNGVSVAEDILEKVEYLRGRVIPDNVNIGITRNYGETANAKVNELIFKLFVATGAVTLLVWYALGWRAAVVVLIVIPVVILVTVFSALILGYTIDRVSLFALIFSIGILVDDAIVVVENIYRRWLIKGEVDTDTSIDAVREVGNPTILATFTVIAALLPMGFVRGMMGPYMEPIPALGSVAMLFSLFAAFIFTPWLAMRFQPSLKVLQSAAEKEHKEAERLEGFFRRIINGLVDDKWKGRAFLIGLIVIFFLCVFMFYTKSVRVKMLPLDNKPEFNIVINFPEGTALPDTANFTNRTVQEIREIPEITYMQSYVGTSSPFNFNGLVRHYYLRNQPWQADIQVQLLDKNDRDRSSHQIAVEVRDRLRDMAYEVGAKVQVVEMPPGPPVLQSVVAEVYGPDTHTRRKVAEDLTQMFEVAPSLDDVDNYLEADYETWHFEVDREKALRLGITVEDINNTLKMSMGDFTLGDLKHNMLLEPTLIKMRIPLEVRSDFSRLGQLPVMSVQGKSVPLAELGKFSKRIQDKPIYHKDLRTIEYVTAETVGEFAAPIYGMLEVEDMLADYTSPDGVNMKTEYLGPPASDHVSGIEWTGEWTVTYETFRDMGGAFMVALVLIYMLVVWEFGNFLLPAVVMSPIPLTLVGIIPGHLILNAEFTATSMIGFIALAGIIVRNSILLVDFAKHEVMKGVSVREAVIQACKARTRPILITAFALLAGSSVILFDPIFQGMAISLMFGGMVSTLLTLLVIPLGCISGEKAFNPPEGGGTGAPVMDGPGTGGGGSAAVTKEEGSSFGEKLAFAKGMVAMMYAMALSMVYSGYQKFKARREEKRKVKQKPSSFEAQKVEPSTRPVERVAEKPAAAPEETIEVRVELEKSQATAKEVVPEVQEAKPVAKKVIKAAPVKKVAKKAVKKVAAKKTVASRPGKSASEEPVKAIPIAPVPVVKKKAPAAKKAAPVAKKKVATKKTGTKTSIPPAKDAARKKAARKGRRGIQLKGDL